MEKSGIVFLQCDTPNQNGRIYPKQVVEDALLKYQLQIQSRKAIGGFVSDIQYSQHIDIGFVSHIITHAEIKGDELIGSVEVFHLFPKGAILAAIINNPNTQFGVRGYGNVDSNSVVSNFQIHSINVFIESAADRAKQKKVSANYAYDRAMGIVKK